LQVKRPLETKSSKLNLTTFNELKRTHENPSDFNAANMLGNLTPYRSMSVNKGFYISKERA